MNPIISLILPAYNVEKYIELYTEISDKSR